MYPSRSEPTICEVLSDPMVGAMMRADGVTLGDIEAMVRVLARRQHAGRARATAIPVQRALPARHSACGF